LVAFQNDDVAINADKALPIGRNIRRFWTLSERGCGDRGGLGLKRNRGGEREGAQTKEENELEKMRFVHGQNDNGIVKIGGKEKRKKQRSAGRGGRRMG
jgi:hypothetical protein